MDRYQKAAQNRAKANALNKAWGVGAVQARYRETGNWYHVLERFPAALFDATGYILFGSERELRQTDGIHIGKQLSVPGGISGLPRYRRMIEDSHSVVFDPDEIDDPAQFWEGSVRRVSVNAYERDPAARRACIAHFGLSCQICGFDFAAVYGQLGLGFIHVHHLRPLSAIGSGYTVDPIHDLLPVCPNCHAMLHQQTPPLSPDMLRKINRVRPEKPNNGAAGQREGRLLSYQSPP
jgi:5-methylcytosine-specific restriction endonuclease McrA